MRQVLDGCQVVETVSRTHARSALRSCQGGNSPDPGTNICESGGVLAIRPNASTASHSASRSSGSLSQLWSISGGARGSVEVMRTSPREVAHCSTADIQKVQALRSSLNTWPRYK